MPGARTNREDFTYSNSEDSLHILKMYQLSFFAIAPLMGVAPPLLENSVCVCV